MKALVINIVEIIVVKTVAFVFGIVCGYNYGMTAVVNPAGMPDAVYMTVKALDIIYTVSCYALAVTIVIWIIGMLKKRKEA